MGDSLVATVGRLAAAASGCDPARAVAAVVAHVAAIRGVDVDFRVEGRPVPVDPAVAATAAHRLDPVLVHEHGSHLPGLVREAVVAPAGRRRGGIHHTRPDVAAIVVDLAFDAHGSVATVGDPSVGGGAFLLAAAERLGGRPASVVERLVGCDVDPLAVATTRAALTLWSRGRPPPPDAIRVADFLGPEPFGAARPDVVVGNPPFLGQLRRSTARDESRRAALHERWPDLGPYVDDAAAFLLAATEAVGRGGVVALLLPTSFLAARDGGAVRDRLTRAAPPVALWAPGSRVFDASVDVCVPVCRVGADAGPVRRVHGLDRRELAPADRPVTDSWASLLAAAAGVPPVASTGPALSTLATVTAGFRDHFYGLRDAVVEDERGRHPLITSGLIDPLALRWGRRTCRFDGRRWAAPAVVLDRVDPGVRSWVEARLRPKLVVASQTRVIEAAADPDGRLVPCTPVVVVEPHDPDDLWSLAAVLTGPVASAEIGWVMAGSALSADAVRVSARRLAAVTLPAPGPASTRAAELARSASAGGATALDVGTAVLTAYAEPPAGAEALLDWWAARLPVSSATADSG